jgi:hypothetical protein
MCEERICGFCENPILSGQSFVLDEDDKTIYHDDGVPGCFLRHLARRKAEMFEREHKSVEEWRRLREARPQVLFDGDWM